jgi:hypothetical protein
MTAFVPESAANEAAQAQADARAVSEALEDVDRPSAAERLAASRERMRAWMIETDGGRDRRRRAEAAAAAGHKPPIADRLHDIPVVGLILDAFDTWWSHHPLQGVTTGMAQDRLGPLVHRHPLLTMAGAFFVGMLMVRVKPWRWLGRSAIVAGLTGQIVSRAIAAIPLEALLGLWMGRGHAAEDESAEARQAAAQSTAESHTGPSVAEQGGSPEVSRGTWPGEPPLPEEEMTPPVGATEPKAQERVREGAPTP